MKLDLLLHCYKGKIHSTYAVEFEADYVIHHDSATPHYIWHVYKPTHYFTTEATACTAERIFFK